MADSSFQVAGPTRFNQLGGAYFNGKPIPIQVRQEIIALAQCGVRPCEISRRLRITHGCISKLLSKYRKTGSVDPGGENVGRPRVITPLMAQKIEDFRREQPGMFSWEIRDRLLHEKICSTNDLPSLSSISRLIKNRRRCERERRSHQQCCSNTSYMIANILNLPSNRNSSAMDNYNQSASVSTVSVSCGLGNSGYLVPLEIQRKERTKYTSRQIYELEAAFRKNHYPSAADRDKLAREIGVDKARIQVWFSNQRAKAKKGGPTDSRAHRA